MELPILLLVLLPAVVLADPLANGFVQSGFSQGRSAIDSGSSFATGGLGSLNTYGGSVPGFDSAINFAQSGVKQASNYASSAVSNVEKSSNSTSSYFNFFNGLDSTSLILWFSNIVAKLKASFPQLFSCL